VTTTLDPGIVALIFGEVINTVAVPPPVLPVPPALVAEVVAAGVPPASARKMALAFNVPSVLDSVKVSGVVPVSGVLLIEEGSCKAKLKMPPEPIARFCATGVGLGVVVVEMNKFTVVPTGNPAALTFTTVPGGPLTGFSPNTGLWSTAGGAVGTGVAVSSPHAMAGSASKDKIVIMRFIRIPLPIQARVEQVPIHYLRSRGSA